MLNARDKTILKKLARDSIQFGLSNKQPLKVSLNDFADHLIINKASFVTLKIDKNLRGCIGSLKSYRPLVTDISNNAFAAAFNDPRFPAVKENELDKIDIHISILSEPQIMKIIDEKDLYTQLNPSIDGIVLQDGQQRSTFLPCVWESLPTPVDFIQQLKLKAGLRKDHWSDTIHFKRYQVEEF